MTELLDHVAKILPTIQGWCCFEKAKKFVEHITEKKPELCVEIGVFGGSSLIPQAMALKHNRSGLIYGIDPWTKDSALEEMVSETHRKWWGELDLNQVYEHCAYNVMVYGLDKHCKLIKAKAEDVVGQFADGSIDLLHIDGNHSEALSYKDATLYLPKVKPGGYIFFDDIWWTEVDNHVTTRKAIIYLLESCHRIDLVNNDCLILQKNLE